MGPIGELQAVSVQRAGFFPRRALDNVHEGIKSCGVCVRTGSDVAKASNSPMG